MPDHHYSDAPEFRRLEHIQLCRDTSDIGGMAVFLGIILVFCCRDLKHRASLVVWEAILRLGGFAIMAGYGVWRGLNTQTVISGVFDLLLA